MKKTIANRSHNIHNTNYGHLDIAMWYTYKNFISQFYLTISLMMKMFTQWYWSCCFCNSIKGLHDKSDERCCIVLGRYICIGAVMRWPFSDNAQWIYLYRYHNLSQRRESWKWDRQVLLYLLRWTFVTLLELMLHKCTAFTNVISSYTPFQTLTRFQFSVNKWLAVVSPWWRHQMGTFSALLAICAGNSPVPGEFPAQRPVTRSFEVFFDLRLKLSCPLWHQCDAMLNGQPIVYVTIRQ